MAVQLFRTRYFIPMNVDGSYGTPIELTDANTAFVFSGSTYGSDSNPGTRISPVATITQANTLGKTYTVHRGTTTENPTAIKNLISDCGDSYINGTVTSYGLVIYGVRIKNITANRPLTDGDILVGCIIENAYGGLDCIDTNLWRNNLIINLYTWNLSTSATTTTINKNTIINFKNYISGAGQYIEGGIIVNEIDWYSFRGQTAYIPIFKYFCIRKNVIHKWNGSIISITYGVDSAFWIQDVRDSLTTYANTLGTTDKNYLLKIVAGSFALKPEGGESCQIIDDITGIPIFNKYSGTNPSDYSLFLDANNLALYMSAMNDYVGAFSGNVGGMIFGDITDVDVATGLNTANVPDLLAYDATTGNHYAVSSSLQYWNRVESNVLQFARGYSFDGINSLLKSGIGQKFLFGKLQPFTLTNIPVESVEILPYDNLTTPSAFPKFSAKFYGSTKMWYHTTGVKSGTPVLFNDLASDYSITTNKDLSIYGGWAVTDADSESYELSGVAGCGLQPILLIYFKFQLNQHYYD